jgi:hypothetical protein
MIDVNREFEFPILAGGQVVDLLSIHKNRDSGAGQWRSVFSGGSEKTHIALGFQQASCEEKKEDKKACFGELHENTKVNKKRRMMNKQDE